MVSQWPFYDYDSKELKYLFSPTRINKILNLDEKEMPQIIFRV